MTSQHPITPPPELVHQWHKEACKDPYNGGTFFESKTLKYIATQAARWGADQQLELDARWLDHNALNETHLKITPIGDVLKKAMRPKPPSLKEQALAALNVIEDKMLGPTIEENLIRKALEQLDD